MRILFIILFSFAELFSQTILNSDRSSNFEVPITYDSSVTSPASNDDDIAWNTSSNVKVDHATYVQFGNSDAVNYSGAIRFPGVNIPAGATFDSAKIFITANSTRGVNACNVIITALDSANAAPNAYTAAGGPWATRVAINTTANNTLEIPDFTSGVTYSYNVLSIIQELYTSYSPYSNEAILIFIKNNGSGTNADRRVNSYNLGSNYAILKIWYHY